MIKPELKAELTELGSLDLIETSGFIQGLLESNSSQLNKMYYYIGQGEKIKAIKYHRAITGTGLKESKDYIEKIMEDFAKNENI